jgi:GT2 family glycosyltransferase
VYRGHTGIDQFVPRECYIDALQFKKPKEMLDWLCRTPESTWEKYHAAGREFIRSSSVVSPKAFAERFISTNRHHCGPDERRPPIQRRGHIFTREPFMKPKFTIAIPAYKLPEYLRQAISSCLAQTESDFEIVVSDDCSVEDLGLVAKSFGDSRIRYYRNAARLRAAKNFQRSVYLSQGEYVVNLNSDDLLLPTYLEVAGAALDQCREAAAVYSAAMCMRGSSVTRWLSMPKIHFANRQGYLDNRWLEKFHNVGPTCCLFRKSAFDTIGGYRVSLRFAADWDLFMRFMTVGGGVLFLPQILSIARSHEGQMTRISNSDGLPDILDLWQLDEYSHWPAWEIALLALTQASAAVRTGGAWSEILHQIRSRGLASRVLRGVPRALLEKARQKMLGGARVDSNYEPPANVESAMRAAAVLIGS